MSARRRALLSAFVMVAAAACGNEGDGIQQGSENVRLEVPMVEDASVPSGPDASLPDASLPDAEVADAAPPSMPSNLPCDVEDVLAKHCQSCHKENARNGVPLMTRANLLAQSMKDPTLQIGDRVLLRMAETEKPMPPIGKGEPVPEESRAVLESWVEQGMPAGTCVR